MQKRQKIIFKTSLYGIILNIILVAAKVIVGFAANSIAIILEAVNNLTDVFSSLITAVGAKLANRAPDKEHPYGHGRIEHIATFCVSLIILATGLSAIYESAPKILNPPQLNHSIASIIVLIMSIVTKIGISLYFRKAAKAVKSDSLRASGIDAFFDAIISLATLISVILYMTTGLNIEGILGAVISIFILKTGIEVLRESWRDLIGRRTDSQTAIAIKKRIASFPSVSGAYDLALHNYGPGQLIGSVHIQIPDNLTAKDIHKLTREISETIYNEFHAYLTIGIYAENSDTKTNRKIRQDIEAVIATHPEITQLHGFYVDEASKLIAFDIIFDFDYPHKNRSKNQISRALHQLYPNYRLSVTIDVDTSD